MSRAERLIGLDLFRIFAVLMIFFFHTGHIECSYGILSSFISQGAMFMTAFFMLSGFALFYSNRTKDLSRMPTLKAFYVKRFIGIVPVYWVIASLYTLYSVVVNGESVATNLILLPVEAAGLQSVFCSVFDISHNNGTWFVSCILFCYAIFPFMLLIIEQMKRKSRITFYILMTGILLYSPIVVGALKLDNIYSNPFFRICEFVIGMLICSVWLEINESRGYKVYLAKYWIVVLELIVLMAGVSVASLLHIPNVRYMLYSWIGIPMFTLMLMSLCGLSFGNIKNSKLLKYSVDVSYVFFFAQFFTWPICRYIFLKVGGVENIQTRIKAPVALVVCILLTIIIHEFIEKPVVKSLQRRC